MKILIAFLFIMLPFTETFTQSYSENFYADYIQTLIGGEREVRVKGGRVDIVTDEYAIEVEKAASWKEAIGQSLWYALNTNKKPGIILIVESEKQYTYFLQLNSALAYANLSDAISVWLFPQDFEQLMNKDK